MTIMRRSQLDFVVIFPKYVTTQFKERVEEHCRYIPFIVVTIMEKRLEAYIETLWRHLKSLSLQSLKKNAS